MGNFQRDGNRGGGFRGGNGGNNRGGRSDFHGGNRGKVSMFKTICSECNKSCEVPFHPSSDKPVYCNDCFSNKRDSGDRTPRRSFGDREPRRDFNKSNSQSSFAKSNGGQEDLKKQLNEINVKLDRLVGSIDRLTQGSKVEVKQEKVPAPKVEIKKNRKAIKKTSDKKVVIKKTSKIKVVSKKVSKPVKKIKAKIKKATPKKKK